MVLDHLFVVGHLEAYVDLPCVFVSEREVIVSLDDIVQLELLIRYGLQNVHQLDSVLLDVLAGLPVVHYFIEHGQFAEHHVRYAHLLGEFQVFDDLRHVVYAFPLQYGHHPDGYYFVQPFHDVGEYLVTLDGLDFARILLEPYDPLVLLLVVVVSRTFDAGDLMSLERLDQSVVILREAR